MHFLEEHPNTPILFDSIIRSKEQNDILGPLILDFSVIFLQFDEETAVRRLSGRRIDPETNEVFPVDFKGDTNPKTGNKLVSRSDDTPESIRSRISWSIRDTLPLIGIWRSE
jgi:adenylate kinase